MTIGTDVDAKIAPFSAKKRLSIVKTAHDPFLDKGYELTSMDDIATRAKVIPANLPQPVVAMTAVPSCILPMREPRESHVQCRIRGRRKLEIVLALPTESWPIQVLLS